jgi:hypothetical protein
MAASRGVGISNLQLAAAASTKEVVGYSRLGNRGCAQDRVRDKVGQQQVAEAIVELNADSH